MNVLVSIYNEKSGVLTLQKYDKRRDLPLHLRNTSNLAPIDQLSRHTISLCHK